MKKIAGLLIFCLILTAIPAAAHPLPKDGLPQQGDVIVLADNAVTIKQITVFSDGSTLIEAVPHVIYAYLNSITYQKSYYYRNSSGNLLWTATLTGTFTYNGSTSACTNASCNTVIYDSVWHEGSINAYASGASANADVSMVRKFLFVTVETVNISLSLTCDKDGNMY